MKNKNIFLLIYTLFLFVVTLNAISIKTNALTIFDGVTSDILGEEFYTGDYHIFKKGYYLLVGEGDISQFSFSGNISAYLYKGSNLTISTFETQLGVESEHKSELTNAITKLNNNYSTYPKNQAFLIKVDNFGKMTYGDGDGCWGCYSYGVETFVEDSSSQTYGRYHVLSADNRPNLSEILAKYTFSDNVDSASNITINSTTSYNGSATLGAFPLYIEAIDTSGNVSTTLDYIYVHDFVAPTIETSQEIYEIEVHTVLTSEDVKGYFNVSDNFTILIGIKKTYDDQYNSQYNKVGQYSLTCTAKDQQGNTTSKTISINVVDTTKPTIALKGGGDTIYSNKELSNLEIFNLLDINDNYDTITEDQVTITTNCEGVEGVKYTVDVTVTDSSNNTTNESFNYYINDTTAPNITVRDTVYLDKNRNYTSEEILAILKAAGIISNDATNVSFIDEELISSSSEEDVYKVTYEETLSDGTVNYGFITLKYQKEANNNLIYYIVIPSVIITGVVIFVIIKKRKKTNANQ